MSRTTLTPSRVCCQPEKLETFLIVVLPEPVVKKVRKRIGYQLFYGVGTVTLEVLLTSMKGSYSPHTFI